MTESERMRSFTGGLWKRSRMPGIVFFILLLLGGVQVAEWVVIRHYERSWDAIVEQTSKSYLARAEDAFITLQRSTRRLATEIAQHPVILSNLAEPSGSHIALFSYLSRLSNDLDVGIEVFNGAGEMVAWEGRSGHTVRTDVRLALDGQLTSYVTTGPIYSTLFITVPIRSAGGIVGAVTVRQTVEVNYPVSNKFINREGLSVRLTEQLGVPVEYDFFPGATPRKDGRYMSSYLQGIDGSRLGVVSVMRPSRAAYLEVVAQKFGIASALAAVTLLATVVVGLVRLVRGVRSLLLRALFFSGIIWGVRYLLLWLDVPSSLFTTGVFDPAFFASKFGGGLAKSIGEMFLSSVALLVNTLVLFRLVAGGTRRSSPWWRPWNPAARGLLAVAATVLVYLVLRGYGATIRSAVFDSTLSYADPGVIVPTFELGMMVVNLFIISFCMILAVLALTSFIVSLMTPHAQRRWRHWFPWFAAAFLFLVAAVLFGVVQENPLMTTWFRGVFGACMLALTFLVHKQVAGGVALLRPSNLLLILGLSAVFFYPLLDKQVRQKDRERLQMFATEVLRPVDSWLAFVVEEALQRFSNDETVDALLGGRQGDIGNLAFLHWANSVASREGYNCRFEVLSANGEPVSTFSIGSQTISRPSRQLPETTRVLDVTEIGSGINAVKVYEGSTPILSPDGDLVGWGVVVVAAGQQALFRGESPAVLRSSSQETIESFYRPVTVSEFRDGVLFASNNPALPILYRLQEEVANAFADPAATSLWHEEEIDGTLYEVYYVRSPGYPSTLVALSFEHLAASWHLLNIVKVMVYYAVIVGVLLLVLAAYRWIRGVRYVATFRDKILVAFLVTSIVPVIVLAAYGRMVAQERMMEVLEKRLQQETSTVIAGLLQRSGNGSEAVLAGLTALHAEGLAGELGIDVNVYSNAMLLATSRPELYELGILDKRLSGTAYERIMRQGKRFHLQRERIGSYEYVVGYAPVLDDNKRIIAVVSVPTLYHQEEIDRDVSERNALLFGIYGVLLLVIIAVATALANRIAAPIHRLTEATKRVSQGDLNVDVRMPAVDGEIGELVRSFDSMIHDLKRNRSELVRYERELAWKEMAKQVAHEIKNPLTPMKLSLQHLRQTYADKVPDFHRVFDEVSRTIIEQIDALSRIASEFSHFGRMPRARRERCHVNDILMESIHLFEQEQAVRFEMDLAPNVPPVLADKEELRRAFINIIRNGIQAMEGKGRMLVSTEVVEEKAGISFRDFGSGMNDQVKAKLFQPNFSTKADGMGLGLAIVKKCIDDLGGSINVESIEGEGTTVRIVLPGAPMEGAE